MKPNIYGKMIKIFPTEKVKELDQYTIENEPILSIDLVERASMVFIHEFCRRFSKQYRIVVFAGPGNNGADGLAISRLLKEEGYRIETYLFNPTEQLSVECAINKERLVEIEGMEFKEVIADFVPPKLTKNDIVIDGLFGSGLNRSLSGGFAGVVNYINQSEAYVVSIDIPSGLFGENNRENNENTIIHADLTLAFAFPKLAFLLPENEKFVGEWKVLDIGLHEDIINEMSTDWYLVTEEDVAGAFPGRDKFANKGNFGHALLIAGSRGKLGASILSSKACLRSGAGLVSVHIPQCGEQVMQTAFPEAMVDIDVDKEKFTQIDHPEKFDHIGIGPGLGQHLDTAVALERLLSPVTKPMVIDADALNIISSNKELLDKLPKQSILTPHPKEFDRLAGESTSGYERLMKAQKLAKEYKVCLLLKGAYTAVCTPNGKIFFNTTGNPGMATAGSGDVLTGIILGLLSQGIKPESAAIMGVFLHGTAGDLAANLHSEESMIAGDIIEMLGKAFKQLK